MCVCVCTGQHIQNINWGMSFLILCWFVITIIYIVVRATRSLKLGKATAYGVWVLVMEVTVHPRHFLPAVVTMITVVVTRASS